MGAVLRVTEETIEMSALVVYESCFGNTALVARSVGDGIAARMPVRVCSVADLDAHDLDAQDLVVVGGSTHAFGMGRPRTRQEARERLGERPSDAPGIRELIDGLTPDRRVRLYATFDTRVEKVRHLPGSAAHSAARALRHDGHRVVDRGASFYVADVEGPLLPRELDRAREWGDRLALRSLQMLQRA